MYVNTCIFYLKKKKKPHHIADLHSTLRLISIFFVILTTANICTYRHAKKYRGRMTDRQRPEAKGGAHGDVRECSYDMACVATAIVTISFLARAINSLPTPSRY